MSRTHTGPLMFWFFAACLFCMGHRSVPPCSADTAAGLQENQPLPARSEADINLVLSGLAAQGADFPSRIRTLAAAYVGAPYIRNPLHDETSDWFPFRTVDCTMFVLCVTAFANSRSVAEAREHMRLLHYRDGVVGYGTRYHFTEDRITDPANHYFTAVTEKCVRDQRSLRRVTVALNRKKDGAYLFRDRLGTWSKTVTLSYLPRRKFRMELLDRVPAVCGIAFVKWADGRQGLLVGHEGLLIDGDLYHASPDKGVCRVARYLERVFPNSPWEGFMLFSINETPRLNPIR